MTPHGSVEISVPAHVPSPIMRLLQLLIITFMLSSGPVPRLLAQGCIAVRGGGFCSLHGFMPGEEVRSSGSWEVSVAYRWLHSHRHFVGDVEQTQREDEGTQVENFSNFIDLGVSYSFTPRYAVALTIPFVYSERSSLYEHKGNASGERYETQAGGLADVRAAAYAWLWDPVKRPRGNVQLGLGFKAPTGDYAATDIFHRTDGPTLDYVDQSIQPGDGGWGITAEMYAFREIVPNLYGYLQGFYLFNPRNYNGTPRRVANRDSTDPFDFMSVTDQYLARAGASYVLAPKWGLSASLGGRIDGVPATDAIGDSEGFRRPGYAVSIEPGLTWQKGSWTAVLTTPVAVYRNRIRSVQDKIRGTHGDAAFADFFITAAIARRF